jgi:hypothetical protein
VGGWGVLGADIQDVVDPIAHGRRLRLVQRRVSERRGLNLLRPWLTVGVVEEGRGQAPPPGTPPGGVLRPRLAHIDLHGLESWWEARQAGVGRLSRDADDLVVVCRPQPPAGAAPQSIGRILEWVKLTLHPDKTRVVGMADAGVDFRGCPCPKQPAKRTRRLVPYAWPSGKARRGVRAQIRPQTARCRRRVARAALVAGLNRVLRGGRTYVRVGHATQKLADRARYVRRRRWIFRRNRQGRRGHWRPEGEAAWLRRSGLARFSPTGWGHVQPCMPCGEGGRTAV